MEGAEKEGVVMMEDGEGEETTVEEMITEGEEGEEGEDQAMEDNGVNKIVIMMLMLLINFLLALFRRRFLLQHLLRLLILPSYAVNLPQIHTDATPFF